MKHLALQCPPTTCYFRFGPTCSLKYSAHIPGLTAARTLCTFTEQVKLQFQHLNRLRHFQQISKSDYCLRHVRPSVRLRGTTRLTMEGLSIDLIFEYLSKICRANSIYIKI